MTHRLHVSLVIALILWAPAIALEGETESIETLNRPRVEQLLRGFQSDDRETKAAALMSLGTPEAVPILLETARSENEGMARAAAEVLIRQLSAGRADVSPLALAAMEELRDGPNQAVADVVNVTLDFLHNKVVHELQSLGAIVHPMSTQVEERRSLPTQLAVVINLPWTGGEIGTYLNRFRGPVALFVISQNGVPTTKDLKGLRGLPRSVRLKFDTLAAEETLASLEELVGLRELSIRLTAGFTDSGLAKLAQIQQLESLSVAGNGDVGPHLHHLKQLTHLKDLTIVYAPEATCCGLAYVARIPALERLKLAWNWDSGLSVAKELHLLQDMAQLKELTLEGRRFDDSDMATVSKITRLQSLTLMRTCVSDDGIRELAPLEELTYLAIENAAISDDAIEHVKRLKKLAKFRVRETFVSSEGIAALQSAFPDINLETPGQLRESFSVVHRRAATEIVRMGGIIDGENVRRGKVDDPRGAVRVTIGVSWQGTDDDLRLLADLDKIDELSITTAGRLTDDGLRYLKELPELGVVRLEGPFTDAAVEHLRQCKATRVSFRNTQVSRDARQRLDATLEPNRLRAGNMRDQAELDAIRSLVEMACLPLPPRPTPGPRPDEDPELVRRQRMEFENVQHQKDDAIRRLGRGNQQAVLIVEELANGIDPERRLEALRLLVGMQDFSAKEALARLRNEQSGSAIERTPEEKALLELDALGATVRMSWGGQYSVSIRGENGDDAGLMCLKHLTSVRELTLSLLNVDPEYIRELADLETLQELHINTALTSDASAELPRLRSLTWLSMTGVTDDSLRYVGQLGRLRILAIRTSPELTGAGLQHLAQLNELRSLEIFLAPRFHGDGLEAFAGHSELSTIQLYSCGTLGSQLACLKQIPALERFCVSRTQLLPGGCREVGLASQIREMDINQSTISDDNLRLLVASPNLWSLRLDGNGISDAAVPILAELPYLRTISLDSTYVSTEAEGRLYSTSKSGALRKSQVTLSSNSRRPRQAPSAETLSAAKELIAHGAGVYPSDSETSVALFGHWSGDAESLALIKRLDNVVAIRSWLPVDDSLVKVLKELPHLRAISLVSPDHTREAAHQLQRALPDVRVSCVHDR